MRQVVLLDRDGTLIEDVGYISDYKKIIVKEGVFEGLLKLKKAGFTLVIVSNQSGIAKNLISEEEFQLVKLVK
jgi:D-glycero-D-manno-heptose 1,7-bisphosphate phosphatase